MSEEFDKLVELLDSNPVEQCVVPVDFLINLGIDAEVLGKASKRSVSVGYDFISVPEKNMVLRDRMFVFSARENA